MKSITRAGLIVLMVTQLVFQVYGETWDAKVNDILSSAESVFNGLKRRNYQKIWMGLTLKSRNTIRDSTYKALSASANTSKQRAMYDREQIAKDFAAGGSIAKSYWDGYLQSFDPGMVLEQSTWEMGTVESDRAEVIIRYRKAVKPAVLKMFREDGVWKVGLMETFSGSRRWTWPW